MRPMYHTLDAPSVYRHCTERLQRHLPLRPPGPHAHGPQALLIAATRLTSLSAICRRLREAPSDETARRALLATLPDFDSLVRRLNDAPVERLPAAVRRRAQPVAIDLVLIPYHGQPHRRPQEIDRSKPRHGTSHFHAYATATIVAHGSRFTLALVPVPRRQLLETVLHQLLAQVATLGVPIKCLLLDSDFYEVRVITMLQRRGLPFLMPVVRRGRAPPRTRRGPAAPGGSKPGDAVAGRNTPSTSTPGARPGPR